MRRTGKRWPIGLVGVAVALHLLMMGSLFGGYFDPLIYPADRSRHAFDFFAVYEAGHKAIENRSVYEYDPHYPVAAGRYYAPYRYLPFLAYTLGIPANALPPWPAYWALVGLNELLLVLNAYATWRISGRSKWGVVGAAMWFVFSPFYLEQYLGQFTFLMATALLWTGIGLVRGREILAGVPWAVSLVIKSSSALVGPLLLRLGWWRALAFGGILVGVNLPYFLWRPADLGVFFDLNVKSLFEVTSLFVQAPLRAVQFSPGHHGLLALFQNVALVLDPSAQQAPEAISYALVIGVVGPSLLATVLGRRVDPLVLFTIWVSAFFLFYVVVWEYHYLMLLPVLVLLVVFRPAVRPLALAVFLLLALPGPYWFLSNVWNTGPLPESQLVDPLQEVWPGWGVVLYHAAKPVPVAVLWLYLVVTQLRGGLTISHLAGLRNLLGSRPATRAQA